ncbi:hypothetical protein [Bradyrhizobium sp. SZCCHNR1093]|uniref:hypothetical protein n=1 Tax=Bradyrhizobium sp. SZCCHNR1093 TaxID=3057368 RepID=UPI0028F06D01|nr:hypothetical protein [Bradyrhizobium sp. SZCCHNR1093]
MREIEDLMANVATRLTVMRFTPGQKDVAGLRESLQELVNKVMAHAHDCQQ